MLKSVFIGLCPNCGGDIASERLELGFPCQRCMPKIGEVCSNIEIEGLISELCKIREECEGWERFFERRIGSKPWSLQSTWMKRVLLGRSFALLAPTGVGKTSFGVSVAAYLAMKGRRSYILVPTKMLVSQLEKKLLSFGVDKKDLLFFGDDNQKEKEEKRERLQSGDFKVLLTTSMFLYKNYDKMPTDFDFIFVDDVDSFLKTARNVDKVLSLMGFSKEDIEKAIELIRIKSKPNKSQEDWDRIKDLTESLNAVHRDKKAVLVVSSATSNPKSNRVKLFRELLGFEVGAPTFYLRNVEDTYIEVNKLSADHVIQLVRILGKGGLLFVSSDLGKKAIDELVKELKKHKIEALSYEELNENGLKAYESGAIDLLVGIASYRNPLARGFDMPHVVRYAIFYGVPKIEVSLKFEENPSSLLWALMSIRSLVAKHIPQRVREVENWIERLKKYQYISEDFIRAHPELRAQIENMTKNIRDFLTSEEVRALIESSDEITLRMGEKDYYLVVSDATGYLQASGRVSRMYAGGISKGLSVLLVDDKRAFKHLQKKVRWFSEDIVFKGFEEVDIQDILKQVDSDRQKIRAFLSGEEKPESAKLLDPVLILVESPNKARTIANFFGKAVRRRVGDHELLETSMEDKYLMISSSLGHVLDLNKERGFHGVDVDNAILPYYETIEGKEEIISSLRLMALEAKEVLIATDPDTEGEKIGWDLMNLLKPFVSNVKRMEFHEITKKAIVKAIKEPREFNENLVKAQVVRRISDRWVGFEFSQVLQKACGKNWLSAGRVQTPVLGWIIEREKEYRKKVYKVLLKPEDTNLTLEFLFEDKKKALEFLNKVDIVKLDILETKEETVNPPPPYRTDTVLKDTSERFRLSLSKIMEILQDLFELGYITYHRTDYLRVSDVGMGLAKEYISEELGKDYVHPRPWSQEGAHECIRPTKPIDPEDLRSLMLSGQVQGIGKDHLSVYTLIFNRFMASQTRAIKVKVATVKITTIDKEQILKLPIQILEDGWNRFLPYEVYQIRSGLLKVTAELKQQPKAYLFTQGEIVQRMKERGIGRPSTYATIVSKLIERGYVIDRSGFLIPTKLGKEVFDYLQSVEEIRDFLTEEFTRYLESLMDAVEEGRADYEDILKSLYQEIQKVDKMLIGE